jgi:hypothetical protein
VSELADTSRPAVTRALSWEHALWIEFQERGGNHIADEARTLSQEKPHLAMCARSRLLVVAEACTGKVSILI